MTVYYWPGLDNPHPSGGVRTHYDHVRILNAAGVPASILHMAPGFRPPWFTEDVPIAYAPTTELHGADVLVLNEIMGVQTADIAPGIRKLIFAQNVHYVWRGWPIDPPGVPVPYRHSEFIGTMVLTDTEREFFEWVFPTHPVATVPHGITTPLGVDKKRQIAFMPRKHPDEAQQVFGWLRATGALTGWDVVAIDHRSEAETAQILGESLVFFAFGYPEGGTKPPFEAMAAGCVVVGYGGFASDRLMEVCGAALIPSGDSCQFARVADGVLRTRTDHLLQEGRRLSETVRQVLPPEGERDALLKFLARVGVA